VLEYTLINRTKITINAPSSVTNLADWQVTTQIQSVVTNGESRSQELVFSTGVGTITTETYLVTDAANGQVFLATSMSGINGDRMTTNIEPIAPAAIDLYASIARLDIAVKGKDPNASLEGWEVSAQVDNLISNGESGARAIALSQGTGRIETQTYLTTDGKTATTNTAFALASTSDFSSVGTLSQTTVNIPNPLPAESRNLSGILPDRFLVPIFALDRAKGEKEARDDKQTRGTAGGDAIFGTDRRDILTGYAGNDFLYGYDGNDKLEGGAGNDMLDGGAGNDRLDAYGAVGDRDLLFGGAGKDLFILAKGCNDYYLGDGYATISDFNAAAGDRLKLGGKWKDYTFTLGNSTPGEATTAIGSDLVVRLASSGDAIAVLQNVSTIDRQAIVFG
jgi:Ca2+-binding RTX toxin-like protein